MQAMQAVLEKNPQGFESKYTATTQWSDDNLVTHRNGCRCRKSSCLKKYCECYQGKVYCSSICTCSDCHNGPDGPRTYLARAHSLSSLEHNVVYVPADMTLYHTGAMGGMG
ncbi:hypothetical protein EON65_34125, partial [archaeon]